MSEAAVRNVILVVALVPLLLSCGPRGSAVAPVIEFTEVPVAGEGSPEATHEIGGRVRGGGRGQRIVLYARSGVWWVQPTVENPWTAVSAEGNWKSHTHPGSAYAAVLVEGSYHPATTMEKLPEAGGAVLAVAMVEGRAKAAAEKKLLRFAGYDWEVREAVSDRGGTRNSYDPRNVWTDSEGKMHLRISRDGDKWRSAEVMLTRSLGYGSYRFVVRDIGHLEPAAVFSIFTWDDTGPAREMDIEISRWGEPESRNAQYLVQPYFVPANAVRFVAPAGMLTHWMHWQPGRVRFETKRGAQAVDAHEFSSGIPAPGNETVHLNLYVFDNTRRPLKNGTEVVVDAFEYLP